MSMAPTTDQQSQRIDLGQRLYMLGIFAIFVVEAVSTIVNVGMWFEWSSLVLGALSSVGILYLGNWLYRGDKTALSAMRIWVAVELTLVLIAVVLLGGEPPGPTIARHLGVNVWWQGLLKILAYGGFAGVIFCPSVVLEFLGAQRGEATAAAPETAAAAAPVGEPVTLNAEQTQALAGLRGAMRMAGGILLVVGVFEMVAGLVLLSRSTAGSVLCLVEGVAVAALGAEVFAPAGALQALLDVTPRNMGYVIRWLNTWLTTAKLYVVIFALLGIVAVLRLVLRAW